MHMVETRRGSPTEVRLGFSIFSVGKSVGLAVFFIETLGDLPIVWLSPIKALVQNPKITPMILEQGTSMVFILAWSECLVGVCSERCQYSKWCWSWSKTLVRIASLVNVYKKDDGKIQHVKHGKTHYFDWAMASIAIGSMYGIYTNIGGKLMVNVTIYSIHGSYGIANCNKSQRLPFFVWQLTPKYTGRTVTFHDISASWELPGRCFSRFLKGGPDLGHIQ